MRFVFSALFMAISLYLSDNNHLELIFLSVILPSHTIQGGVVYILPIYTNYVPLKNQPHRPSGGTPSKVNDSSCITTLTADSLPTGSQRYLSGYHALTN